MGRSKRTTRSKSTTIVASTSATSSYARDARRRRAGETTPNLSSIQSSAFASLDQFDENVIAAVSATISPTRGSPVPDTPPIPITPVAPVCNGSVLWTRGLSILQLVALEGRWDTVLQCVW